MPSLEIVDLENARPYGESVTRNERLGHIVSVCPELATTVDKKAWADLRRYFLATEKARRVWRWAEAAKKAKASRTAVVREAFLAGRLVTKAEEVDRDW